MLKDRNSSNRVVDNVMNFFRYKDAEQNGPLVPKQINDPAETYGDQSLKQKGGSGKPFKSPGAVILQNNKAGGSIKL